MQQKTRKIGKQKGKEIEKSKDWRVGVVRRIPVLFVDFPCFVKKKQGQEGQRNEHINMVGAGGPLSHSQDCPKPSSFLCLLDVSDIFYFSSRGRGRGSPRRQVEGVSFFFENRWRGGFSQERRGGQRGRVCGELKGGR